MSEPKEYVPKIGDIVTLKSGGPPMTVDSLSVPGELPGVHCKWFVGHELKSGSFEFHLLAPAEAPKT